MMSQSRCFDVTPEALIDEKVTEPSVWLHSRAKSGQMNGSKLQPPATHLRSGIVDYWEDRREGGSVNLYRIAVLRSSLCDISISVRSFGGDMECTFMMGDPGGRLDINAEEGLPRKCTY